jgi:hypothetical protein
MPTIQEAFDRAKKVWAVENMHFIVGEVREGLTKNEFGIKTDLGNLEARVDAEVLATNDGFRYGTHVDYGVYWELGIHKSEKILRAGPGKFFRIPIGSVQRSRVLLGKSFKADLRKAGAVAKTKGGTTNLFMFRKTIRQPEQTHPPRHWLSGPLEKNLENLRRDAETKLHEAVKESIPDKEVKI